MPLPTFTYACSNCDEQWEEQRDRNDPNLDRSATRRCGRRVFSPSSVSVTYKGRGWARRDHKDASKA